MIANHCPFFKQDPGATHQDPKRRSNIKTSNKKWLVLIIKLAFLYSLAYSNNSLAFKCQSPNTNSNGKKTFCFFSLNNPKEANKLRELNKNPNVEVKEFYGVANAGQNVEERFKDMLKNNTCDSLVISGHHTGYFTGDQSKGAKLDLDFLENMSCEQGCEDWFSNVKSLFLMGCQTTEPKDIGKKTADSETIRVIKKESDADRHMTFGVQHTMMNQAYSSTLDKNNKLSHRYLRMFPNSSLYGWGGTAPGENSNSENSIPNFINLVTHTDDSATNSPTTEDIVNFTDFMNNQNQVCRGIMAGKWTKHWTQPGTTTGAPTACFLKDTSDFKTHQQNGCALTKALNSDNGNAINQALNKILLSGEEGIKANFNRLLSLITNKKNKDKKWYKMVKNKLEGSSILKQTLENGIQDNKVGFTRKADYLYFYKEMNYPGDKPQIAGKFLSQLQKAFEDGKDLQNNKEVQVAYRLSLYESIYKNDLGKWLSQHSPNEFKKLKTKFINSDNEWDKVRGHFLTYQQNDVTSEEKQKSRDFLDAEIKKHGDWFKWDLCKIDRTEWDCPKQ